MNQKEALMKAGVLAEALPWLLKFQDCIVVIKFGGNAMVDKSLLHTFAQDVVFLRLAGLKPIVVHGGGPQITKRLEEKGIISEFKNGYRVTTSEVVGIVKDVLVNEIQKDIVNAINAMKSMAVGISGDEFDLIQVKKMMIDQTIDIGFVGDVERVDIKQIIEVLESGEIPVISSLGIDNKGQIFNVNADSAASAIAKSLRANKLVLLTDVAGLLGNYPDETTLINTLRLSELEKMIPNLDSGMRPKMESCFEAVSSGVSRAHVIDGRKPHALLVEVFTDSGTGTMITKDLD
mgnify:FL=1